MKDGETRRAAPLKNAEIAGRRACADLPLVIHIQPEDALEKRLPLPGYVSAGHDEPEADPADPREVKRRAMKASGPARIVCATRLTLLPRQRESPLSGGFS
jgi:hypothetical protein